MSNNYISFKTLTEQQTKDILAFRKSLLADVKNITENNPKEFLFSHGRLMVAISVIDRSITKESRLKFLSWLFAREITTTNLLQHGLNPGGLLIEEGRALIKWANPKKISDEWTLSSEFFSILPAVMLLFPPPEKKRTCYNCYRGETVNMFDIVTVGLDQAERSTCKCCGGNYDHCDNCEKVAVFQ